MPSKRSRAADPLARWHIVVSVKGGGSAELVLTFDHTPVTVGGASTSDVVLAGPYVSRAHATVAVSGGHLLYRDHSSNGSFLFGKRVDEVPLAPTDVIVVPPYRLSFALQEGHDRFTVLLPPDEEPPADAAPEPPPRPNDDARFPPTQLLEAVPVAHADAAARGKTPGPASFQLRLIRAPGELVNRVFRFDDDFVEGATIAIGRASDAPVSMDLQSVSRRHARLALSAGNRWNVSDLASRNGITVNGRFVESADLADGDEIGFGPEVTAVFRQPAAGTDAPPQDPPSAVRDERVVTGVRRSHWNNAVVVVAISGRIDGYNYADFRDQLGRVLDAGERWVILDFSACEFCDHAGLGVVLSTKTALDRRNGRLCLIGLNQMLTDALSLLGLRGMLAVSPDEAAAVRRIVEP